MSWGADLVHTAYADTTNQIESTIVRIGLLIAGLGLVAASILAHNAQQPDHPRAHSTPGTTIEPRP